jgi:hypothetical protein
MFQRCNKACFKIIIDDKKNIDLENLLEKLELENFNDFFNNLGIFFQTYNISFLSNSMNEYFINFDILVPSLESLLIKKNHQCIFPNCNESIIDYKINFCNNHMNTELTDISVFDKELEQIFTNYKLQKNIYNFLKTQHSNTVFKYNNLCCDLEIVENNIINKLVNIDLQNDMDDIDFMLDNIDGSDNELDDCSDMEDINEIEETNEIEKTNEMEEKNEMENDNELSTDDESDIEEDLDPKELKLLLNHLQLFNLKQKNQCL